jgi:hypothetical protein
VEGKTDNAMAAMKTTRVYPLAQAASPPPMTFFDGSGREIDTVFSEDGRFFAWQGLVRPLPLLWPAGAVLRQDLETCRHREGEISRQGGSAPGEGDFEAVKKSATRTTD